MNCEIAVLLRSVVLNGTPLLYPETALTSNYDWREVEQGPNLLSGLATFD